MSGDKRYFVKREAGISPIRKDGSLTSPFTDLQAAAAEEYAAKLLRVPYNDSVSVIGDGGYDFILPLKIDVKWLGQKGDKPRETGYLIVNNDPRNWADVYILVAGMIPEFKVIGWVTHQKLLTYPLRDFGFGLKLAIPISDLYPASSLLSLRKS